ncbi:MULTISPECIES: hypothetical protein [Microbacterium]|uniref:hypothetical protein n=1 Tax=Microbacterium TaxID=33882 RepID=UPI0006F456B3|nr:MULTISPECIES: hypothetical protein [Microbacterium]KQZ25289.1 hypothetical protein ASD43_13725 [Microbacterium sp. Root553]
MSLNAAVRPNRPAPEAPARTPRRTLQPVTGTPQRRRPRLAYALLAVGGALAIGAAQIGLSLAITQDSFTLAGLTSQQHELDLRTDALQEDLTGMSSPQSLATSAAALGMVVAGSPAYLRLSDGAVFGQGTGAAGASTIDPTGAGAVGNALLNDVPVNASTADDDTPDAPSGQSMQELPPAITDGLPSPSTR